ncbi:MAG: DUF4133 domain-containing protein [Chitinophagaceae bacterium]
MKLAISFYSYENSERIRTAEEVMSSIYSINKGINKPIEFKGLKAQYIWWLGGGLLLLLILFAVLYICGIHPFLCVGIIIVCATVLFMQVYRLSRKYGQYGMMKIVARRSLPLVIKSYSRKVFTRLGKRTYSKYCGDRIVHGKSGYIDKSVL